MLYVVLLFCLVIFDCVWSVWLRACWFEWLSFAWLYWFCDCYLAVLFSSLRVMFVLVWLLSVCG